jgi:hypothetical protein
MFAVQREAQRVVDETSAAARFTERVQCHSQIKVSSNALIVGEGRRQIQIAVVIVAR